MLGVVDIDCGMLCTKLKGVVLLPPVGGLYVFIPNIFSITYFHEKNCVLFTLPAVFATTTDCCEG